MAVTSLPKRSESASELSGNGVFQQNPKKATVNGLHLKVRLSERLSERTNSGLTAAATRGRKGGRPIDATPERVSRARQLTATGLRIREAAAHVKVGKSALHAALRMTDTPFLN